MADTQSRKENFPNPLKIQIISVPPSAPSPPQLKPEWWKVGENKRFFFGLAALIASWFIGARLNSQNDIRNKLVEIRTQYAIQTYQQLAKAARTQKRGIPSTELEDALSNVQLFGTEKQIAMALKVVEDVSTTGKTTLDPLLQDLRNDLRTQVGIDTTN